MEKVLSEGLLKGGEEEKEDLNNQDSIDNNIKKECEMAKKKSSKKSGTNRRKPKTSPKKGVRKAKFKWW